MKFTTRFRFPGSGVRLTDFVRKCYTVGEMQIADTALRDVKLLRPRQLRDERGWFAEMFNAAAFEAAGLPGQFAQDNQSSSSHGVLRGLHYQVRQPQGKLVRVLQGRIWDAVVDLRQGSPEFGHWAGFDLRPTNADGVLEMLWVPPGYAHGFVVLSASAEVHYKVTAPYDPGGEHTLLWNDARLGILWPLDRLSRAPLISAKDTAGTPLADAAIYHDRKWLDAPLKLAALGASV